MSLKANFFSKLALLAAFAAFSTLAMAQNNPTPPKPDSTITQDNFPQKGFGVRKHAGEGFRGMRGGPGFELRGVILTDAQRQQIHAIMEANKPDQATMDQMRSLMEAKRSGTLTPDQQEQLKAFHKQSMDKRRAIHNQIMALLTPEQLQQVEQNKKEMKERWEQRRLRRQTPPQQTPDKPTDN